MKRNLMGLLTCVLVIGLGACLLAQNTDPVVGPVKPPAAGGQAKPAVDANGNVTDPNKPDPAQPPVVQPGPDGVMPGGPGGIPGAMPGGPGMGGIIVGGMPEPREQLAAQAELLRMMTNTLFNPRMAGVMSIISLKDELKLKPDEKIKFFTTQLEKTKTLGLRNAIRMVLKDLYKEQGQAEKAADQLKAMLEENDAAIQQGKTKEDKP